MEKETSIQRTIDILHQMELLIETIDSCLKQNKMIPTEIIILAKKIKEQNNVQG
jgi:hypothetical protein